MELWVVGRQYRGFVEFGQGFGELFLLLEKQAERGVREIVERIQFDLFFEGGGGFVEFFLLHQGDAEIVVGIGVEWIDFELLFEGRDCVIEFAQMKIGEADAGPDIFSFWIESGGAAEKIDGLLGIAGFESGGAGFDEIVSGGGGRNIASAGGGIFDGDELGFIGLNGASESQIVTRTRRGKFAHFEADGAFDGELVAFDFVSRAIFGVIARDVDAHRGAGRFIGRQREFQMRATRRARRRLLLGICCRRADRAGQLLAAGELVLKFCSTNPGIFFV